METLDTVYQSQSPFEGLGGEPEKPFYEILTEPGVSLIMPSEQRVDFIDGRVVPGEFINNRPGGNDPDSEHAGGTSYAKVFANIEAEPFMKPEKLRFPVGSIIVREKLLTENAPAPTLVSAMIKHSRGFSPETNGWEFLVIDKNLSRIKTRQTTGDCAACHSRVRENDLVYKTYLQ